MQRSSIAELKISWSGDFESLKRFVKESLNIVGTWSSPGGEKKLFSSSDVNIQWWKKKKFLAVDGPEASKVIRCLLNFIDSSFAEQCSDNIEVSSDKCQCTGVEMEGVKLDIVILEAKFNKQSDALEKLHNEMASLISKPKAAHLGESFTESTQNGEDIPTEYLQNDKIQRVEADIAILVRGRNSEVNELNNIIDTLNKKSELIEASNVALKHEIVGLKMLKSSNHCNDMGNWNSEQCDHQSLDLINQGTKQKQMQKYGNRTQSLVNNPEGCLNDKAPVHEVSIMVNSKESTKEVNHVTEQRHIPYMSSDTMHNNQHIPTRITNREQSFKRRGKHNHSQKFKSNIGFANNSNSPTGNSSLRQNKQLTNLNKIKPKAKKNTSSEEDFRMETKWKEKIKWFNYFY